MTSKQENKQILAALFTITCLLREKSRTFGIRPTISLTHMQALGYIFQKKGVLMSELARYLGITPPSATTLINTLIAKNFIERVSDPNDRRAIRLRVTPEGNKMLAERFDEVAMSLKGTFSKLNHAERRQLVGLLQKIT